MARDCESKGTELDSGRPAARCVIRVIIRDVEAKEVGWNVGMAVGARSKRDMLLDVCR